MYNKVIFICLLISFCDTSDYYGSGGNSGKGPINAAINTHYSMEVVNVPVNSQPISPQTIIVGPNDIPLAIQFNSASSRLIVSQNHIGAKGGQERTSSQDEPYNLVHEVKRPIFQQVHEIIIPFRQINQEVRPVEENIQTVVAQGNARGGGGGGDNMGGGKSVQPVDTGDKWVK